MNGDTARAADRAWGGEEGVLGAGTWGGVRKRGRFHLNAAVAEAQPASLPIGKGRR